MTRRMLAAAVAAWPTVAPAQAPATPPAPEFGPPRVEGMGFLKNVAIDQHLLPRNRPFDLVPVIEKHPHLLGIGLDENTAIVVWRDRFEVVGSGYVVIYDHGRKLDSGAPFYLLSPGDRYNLKTREAERPETKYVPLERVVKEPWTK